MARINIDPTAGEVDWARRDGSRVVHLAVDGGCHLCGAELEQPARGRRRAYCGEPCRDAVQALDEVERALQVFPWGDADAAAEVRTELLQALNGSLQG